MNVIYLLPSEKKPTGGIKVTLDHSQVINSINNEFSSTVIFIKKRKTTKWKNSLNKILKIQDNNLFGWKLNEISVNKKINKQWFNNKIKIKNDLKFNSKKDFVILPEIFAHFARDLLIKDKVKYAIFVQNGLALNFTNESKVLDEVYKKAKFIISVSDHIDECVEKAFKIKKNKILRINQSIQLHRINYKSKSNLISYMPRKLPVHSNLVLFFLKKHLPKKWRILPIENMSHSDVIKNLKKSKIFLSFSNLEGFGLPPIEAASLGNMVIGYTGEGGKEYWKSPIFKKIEQGDILNFVNEIQKTIRDKKNVLKINQQRIKLLKIYSKKNQDKKLVDMMNTIKKCY